MAEQLIIGKTAAKSDRTRSTPVKASGTENRVIIAGKFFRVNGRKIYLRGVTYGPFRPDGSGCEYHSPEIVRKDFIRMAENGFNAVRTYTVPPSWLLDEAAERGLYVLVGLAWEQHIAFLDSRTKRNDIVRRIREGVRSCTGHPAIMAYAVGNEIPASIVRWYGRVRVERFIRRLYRAAKSEDPHALITYVNFPTTEYLQLPFLDFMSFNLFLESRDRLEKYLSRLQNIANEKPLVMTEIGLDSHSHGELEQAKSLEWQIRTVFASGCAGSFVFSWTDEWYRGGCDIENWGFGVTDRKRNPKLSMQTVRNAYNRVPFQENGRQPMISVIVCSYNEERTIRKCIEGVLGQTYKNYELIVVNDGSNDRTPEIASEYEIQLITIPNGGLSNARNLGLSAARGDIVAYIDGDAYPDPHWLEYLAHAFSATEHVGIGGPNLSPYSDGMTAACVDQAPGGPNHVLSSDQEAEHIPGCNMAFRKDALEAINGFDRQFRIAGDDVDVCWRLQNAGGTLGFHPGAVIWHHCRNSVKGYLKQQFNYGKAEAMLEMKWPDKYNTLGHPMWRGRMYSHGSRFPLYFKKWQVYHGVWGTNLFQSIYMYTPGVFRSLPLMPEWYLLVTVLLGVSISGLFWEPLLLAVPALLLAIGLLVFQALASAAKAEIVNRSFTRWERFIMRSLVAVLHLMQPVARLTGRLRFGLTPWRRVGVGRYAWPGTRTMKCWSEKWEAPERRLISLEQKLRRLGARIIRGSDFDRWDLEVRGGIFGSTRVLMAIEEHGRGRQLIRFRSWPQVTPAVNGLLAGLLGLTITALAFQNWAAAVILWILALALWFRVAGDCSAATAALLEAVCRTEDRGTGE